MMKAFWDTGPISQYQCISSDKLSKWKTSTAVMLTVFVSSILSATNVTFISSLICATNICSSISDHINTTFLLQHQRPDLIRKTAPFYKTHHIAYRLFWPQSEPISLF